MFPFGAIGVESNVRSRPAGEPEITTFRTVNDRIRHLDTFEDSDLAFFVCECDDAQCFRTVPLTTIEYDELRATGGTIFADGCRHRPVLADMVVAGRARLLIGPEVDLEVVLRHRIAFPVRDVGLPVEGAPAG
jgi:hypothetical protein